jgi:hypothetical protein
MLWQREKMHQFEKRSQGAQRITLPARAGSIPIIQGDWALVFLVPDLDILPGTEVALYLNQQTDSWTRFSRPPPGTFGSHPGRSNGYRQ